jgi:transglutaminase-like putative cysteine protease
MFARFRPAEGYLTLIGLMLMLWAVLDSVISANWVEHLDLLGWIAALAFLYAIVAAKTSVPRLVAHLGGTILGCALVLFLVSRTLSVGYDTKDRLGHLWQRLYAWFEITVSGGIGTDNMLFLLFLAFIAWFIAYYGVWSVYRDHGVWVPIIAAGTGLIINLSYARDLMGHALPYLIGAFLLVVRINIFQQERRWKRDSVEYESEFGWDFLSTGLAVSGIIIALVWFAPKAYAADDLARTFNVASRPWNDVESEFSRLFGGLAARYEGGSGRPLGISGISRVMALRSSTNLSASEIMHIESPQRSYWRGVVYEKYTGTGWMMGDVTQMDLAKGDLRLGAGWEPKMRAPITYTVVVIEPRGEVVISAPEPRKFSIPLKVELGRVPSTFQSWTGEGNNPTSAEESLEVGMVRSDAVGRRTSYSAVSLISTTEEQVLRQAGAGYPTWVKERYLQLPRVPKEVGDLAKQVSANVQSPYDKAKAIESYLRSSFTYSENIVPPTGGQDAVAYFLFTGKAGYCDYFASAMSVMLRSIGIPARVAAGYASGTLDDSINAWIIRDSDSHAWVEVYFPEYGWIEFEPTPIRPVPQRQGIDMSIDGRDLDYYDDSLWDSELDWLDGIDRAPFNEQSGFNLFVPRAVGYGGSALIAACLVALLVVFVAWRRGLGGLTVSEGMYARMCRLAGWLGIRQVDSQTPAEYAQTITTIVPEISTEAEHLSTAYVRARFGRPSEAEQASQPLQDAWRRMRNLLIIEFIRGPGLGRRKRK